MAADGTGVRTVTPASPDPRRHVALYLLALVLACVCVAGGVAVSRTHDNREATQVEQERYGDVVAAASAEALALVNIDYRDLETTYDTVRAGATGQFLEEYTESWDEQVDLFKQSRSVSTGKVRAAGVSTIDDDSATVMVVVEGTAQNTATGNEPQQRRYRWRLDVVNVDGAWLTSKLEFVG
jgi:Mce-associated membrane protein